MVIEVIDFPKTESYVDVAILDGGGMIGASAIMHAEGEPRDIPMSCWVFYIHHPKSKKKVLWDVGISADPEDYGEESQKVFYYPARAHGPPEDLPTQLQKRRDVRASEIDAVLFSHAHWDHCRPISKMFPAAHGYFGPGTINYCAPGHTADPKSTWDGYFFDEKHQTEKFSEYTGPWQKFGAFEKAFDFFGDGSLWVIQAPGHMPGNLICCCRIQSGEWVILGSDCAHSRELLNGEVTIATWCVHGKTVSLHTDMDAAYDTMARVREMEKRGVHVCLAHDLYWTQEGPLRNQTLIGLLRN